MKRFFRDNPQIKFQFNLKSRIMPFISLLYLQFLSLIYAYHTLFLLIFLISNKSLYFQNIISFQVKASNTYLTHPKILPIINYKLIISNLLSPV